MKVKYYSDTDSLYIDLSEKTSAESIEVAPGVVLDLDENNNVVGIDIDHASKILSLAKFELDCFPSRQISINQ
jgi:uncharacterized protein YuzE